MPKLKLTKRHIDALVPGAGREHFWDTEVSGFGLRITPAGERIYVVKYRAGDRQRCDSNWPPRLALDPRRGAQRGYPHTRGRQPRPRSGRGAQVRPRGYDILRTV